MLEISEWGFAAIVSYIPEPLGSFLDSLRRSLPGNVNPQAHVTILPPRPLKLAVEQASEQARRTLAQCYAIDIELSSVHFFPETSYLYLGLEEGSEQLHDLHEQLNTGDLHHPERFEFRPHVTLGGPVSADELSVVQNKAAAAWNSLAETPRFAVEEVVFLWLSPAHGCREWKRLWSHKLARRTRSVKAAGG